MQRWKESLRRGGLLNVVDFCIGGDVTISQVEVSQSGGICFFSGCVDSGYFVNGVVARVMGIGDRIVK